MKKAIFIILSMLVVAGNIFATPSDDTRRELERQNQRWTETQKRSEEASRRESERQRQQWSNSTRNQQQWSNSSPNQQQFPNVPPNEYERFTYESDFIVWREGNRITIREYIGSNTEVIIPPSIYNIPVTSIGYRAFKDCKSLASVTIPASVTSIGIEAFAGCTSLASVTIPSGVTSIETRAFEGCKSLASVTIPNSVTSIDYLAFQECTSLASVTIPNSVTSIGDRAFYGTAWFNNQPNGLVYAGKVAYKYKGYMPADTSITLIDGTKGIAVSAFSSCYNLTSVTIPNSVTCIEGFAFQNCTSLTSVTFQGRISSSNFNASAPFPGDLRGKFYATDKANGTPGTYTRPKGGDTWTKV